VRDGTGWKVDGAQRFDIRAGALTPLAPLRIAARRASRSVHAQLHQCRRPVVHCAQRVIHDLELAGRPTKALEGSLWHKLSGPLSSVLMPLLGAVAAFGLARSGKLFVRAVIGMALGFLYFVADNFALAMGNLGAYPPFLAAWAPFLLFLMIGEAVLLRTEE
jgi:lipopolysaccharide export system permease protein